MTVLSADSDKTFHGANNPGPFSWTWRFLANSDIQVMRISAAGTKTILTEGQHYTLTGAGSYQGGSVTLVDPLEVGEDLYVARNTAVLQQTDIRNQGDFYAETHEDVFDQLTMMIQDRDRRLLLAGSDLDTAIDQLADARERVAALESSHHLIIVPAAGGAGDLVVFADATAGPVEVAIAAAENPAASPVVVVKIDDTDNPVTIRPTDGTITSGEGRTETVDLTTPNESIRVVPNAVLNNWFRG